ncbi:ThuA domain-containing protein [Streptomyces sp. NBC_00370]|uniref:ThuA domain-containing protein n=1 Tax=Streptomyces sp. NBC_00370 TaxID=2975728 RepID=UPI002E261613
MERQTTSRLRKLSCAVAVVLGAALLTPATAAQADDPYQVLVFSKTAGFRHDSIPAGIAEIQALGADNGFSVTATEDATAISTENLAQYEAVVFVSTTGDFLDDTQQNALFGYVDGGGGFLGIHAAADAEYETPAYEQLVGAWFSGHPAIQAATVRTEDLTNPATSQFEPAWTHTDELYNYKTDPRPNVHVLQTLDESSYEGGTMGADHPITWCHPQGEGRSFYTGLGHTVETYADPDFQQLLLGGIEYAAGQVTADCAPPVGGGGDEPTAVEGESYSSSSGVQPAGHGGASGGQTLGYIENGDWAGYASVETEGATTFTASVASAGAGGTIEIRSGSATGTLLGSVAVPSTGSWDTFSTVSTQLTGTGSGPLFLSFTGGAGSLFDIDTFTLGGATAAR